MAKSIRVRHPKPQLHENEQTVSDEVPPDSPDEAAQNEDDTFSALDNMSLQQLNAIIDKANSIRDSKIENERKLFLDRVRAEAAELGIPLDQIAPPSPNSSKRNRPSGKSQAEIKFQGPNPGDTWTGRGRLPNWLAAHEAEGRKRDEFLVNKPSE